ncbi:putative orphan protein [Pseudoalteromonas luteoviolacea B = ATCC 29581]|nr:putative orphan protein [Pseudoalteromonas luteoviolacea B = ATCC 29581]
MTDESLSQLSFGVFTLNDDLAARSFDDADLVLTVQLEEADLEALIYAPAEDESVSIHIEHFVLDAQKQQFKSRELQDAQVQLVINHGPLINAVVEFSDDGVMFVSPPMELIAEQPE